MTEIQATAILRSTPTKQIWCNGTDGQSESSLISNPLILSLHLVQRGQFSSKYKIRLSFLLMVEKSQLSYFRQTTNENEIFFKSPNCKAAQCPSLVSATFLPSIVHQKLGVQISLRTIKRVDIIKSERFYLFQNVLGLVICKAYWKLFIRDQRQSHSLILEITNFVLLTFQLSLLLQFLSGQRQSGGSRRLNKNGCIQIRGPFLG